MGYPIARYRGVSPSRSGGYQKPQGGLPDGFGFNPAFLPSPANENLPKPANDNLPIRRGSRWAGKVARGAVPALALGLSVWEAYERDRIMQTLGKFEIIGPQGMTSTVIRNCQPLANRFFWGTPFGSTTNHSCMRGAILPQLVTNPPRKTALTYFTATAYDDGTTYLSTTWPYVLPSRTIRYNRPLAVRSERIYPQLIGHPWKPGALTDPYTSLNPEALPVANPNQYTPLPVPYRALPHVRWDYDKPLSTQLAHAYSVGRADLWQNESPWALQISPAGVRAVPSEHKYEPPGPRVKERKVLGRLPQAVFTLIGGVTEALDLVDVFYQALPNQYHPHRKYFKNEWGAWQKARLSTKKKLGALYRHYDKVDIRKALDNFLDNNLEDTIIGNSGQLSKDAQQHLDELGVSGVRNAGQPSKLTGHGWNPYGFLGL